MNDPVTRWEKEYRLLLDSLMRQLESKFKKHHKIKDLITSEVCFNRRMKLKRAVDENQKTIQSIQFLIRKNKMAIKHFFGDEAYNRISGMNHVNVFQDPILR